MTEEACIGYTVGVGAAVGIPLLTIQCSGLGSSLNPLGSLAVPYGLGFHRHLDVRVVSAAQSLAGAAGVGNQDFVRFAGDRKFFS
jgi:sulfopyruvate decarboxylase TPP-binding subunit